MSPEALARRKQVMQRSMALGHCVCDPRKPCPCPLFKDQGVCECAGERLPPPAGAVRLTELVRAPGCASKIGRRDLAAALAQVPAWEHPSVLIGAAAADDCGVVRWPSGGEAVSTVDVFTPAVDDPATFGRIAAANSLSDIWAMGATPRFALSLIGFPVHALPMSVMGEILAGGSAVMREAGCPVVGGHSWNDEEPRAGYAVVGDAPPGGCIANVGARPGDVIVLTKPIGGGIALFARQIGRLDEAGLTPVIAAMAAVNRAAGEALAPCRAHAATDITGFSLASHLAEMARGSGVTMTIDADAVPLFPAIRALARAEVLPGVVERNREGLPPGVVDASGVPAALFSVLLSSETNGGLAVALAEADVETYRRRLADAGVTTTVIGRVGAPVPGGRLVLTSRRHDDWTALAPPPAAAPPATAPATAPAACCATPPELTAGVRPLRVDGLGPLPAPAGSEAFGAWLDAIADDSGLDDRTRTLINLALSVATKCGPCTLLHTKAARGAGADDAAIAGAIGLGVAFGGASANMAYAQLRKEQGG